MLFPKISRLIFGLCLFLLGLSGPLEAQKNARHAVLLISIDGMHPSYVLEAEKHGLKLPVLREFVSKGAYAERVRNVTPTVTYPNHTTVVTGVLPNEHGIYTNTLFDPFGKEQGAWVWYGAKVKVPTLWHAAKTAGLVTGSVHWPVTVHAKDIDYNVPEYWRTKGEYDHFLMEAVSTPPGFLESAEEQAGSYYVGDSGPDFDEKITRTTIHMIERAHPDFLTVHIVSLDHAEHMNGPFSKEANEVLEKIDGMVGRLMAAERKAHPDSDVVVVSDHGFFPVSRTINLNVELTKAGLIRLTGGAKPQVQSWKAFAWSSGGSASIVLHDAHDRATEDQVNQILTRLAADPKNGIAQVLRGSEVAANGGLPNAAFIVDAKSGYAMGAALTGGLIRESGDTKGTHGYLNTHPEINSAFFIQGPQVAPGKNLGQVDMRQIAPTIARELAVELPTARMQPLPIRN